MFLPSFGNSEDLTLTASDFNKREDHQQGHHQGLDSLARLRWTDLFGSHRVNDNLPGKLFSLMHHLLGDHAT